MAITPEQLRAAIVAMGKSIKEATCELEKGGVRVRVGEQGKITVEGELIAPGGMNSIPRKQTQEDPGGETLQLEPQSTSRTVQSPTTSTTTQDPVTTTSASTRNNPATTTTQSFPTRSSLTKQESETNETTVKESSETEQDSGSENLGGDTTQTNYETED